MMSDKPYEFNIRVTGVLIENDCILLVRQKVSDTRHWSLPGGRAEADESLETAIIREMREETGLSTKCIRLLYLCEKTKATPPLLHITFELARVGGELAMPDNALDSNPISDIRFVPIADLPKYGFSQKFAELAGRGFPGAGGYAGDKGNIGL